MDSREIREKFLNFFKQRNHSIIDSASVITKDQNNQINSTLFVNAGVQPIIPFILGTEIAPNTKLASAQKCIRTVDIEEVGDNTHLTFFEMLGNWSIGDYFKKEAIKWSFEFLTDSKEGLGLDKNRLYVTVFAGDENSPKDTESFEIWKNFLPENRIYFKGADSNWWPAVKNSKTDTWTGPTGPCTEMFYDVTGTLGDLTKEQFDLADEEQKIVEIWNDVFMQYEKDNGKIIKKLSKFAVDTGAGLERLSVILNNKKNVYEIDSFSEIIKIIKENSSNYLDYSAKIIADHIKASCFLISDGVIPTNSDRGYVLRKLIRRMIIHSDKISFEKYDLIIDSIIKYYNQIYPNLNISNTKEIINQEISKFRKTLKDGIKKLNKIIETKEQIEPKVIFDLYQNYGFPMEITAEILKNNNLSFDLQKAKEFFSEHQKLSRSNSDKKFKGGLSGDTEIEKKYHTATHLLHQALRDVCGLDVSQRGSNINSERLRFDFSYNQKISDEQKNKIEEIVNNKIKEALPIKSITLPKDLAVKTGALHFFDQKYPDEVSIYYIGNDLQTAYSKEFCGGPHVSNTKELGQFKIIKEEAVSSGTRRIKAILQ
ncbi:MAG TPA: alanine--tRNA ligase [Candidatus Paceibacterota bacterium]|nr:alanine--tRNA ligase [Candidatus Paceibacterota bacterium]HMP18760.1 alanine--tRNA ligase [Candidatus Paceibacterota bacterium]HMP85321.1 alanine--tRNA ligase [Candidatus Paceibacterota bacterium]